MTRDTPTGSYSLNFETYMSRNSNDTTIFTDTLTLVVTEPVTTTNTTDTASSTTTTTTTTAASEEVV